MENSLFKFPTIWDIAKGVWPYLSDIIITLWPFWLILAALLIFKLAMLKFADRLDRKKFLRTNKKCYDCARWVPMEAKKCAFCGRNFI